MPAPNGSRAGLEVALVLGRRLGEQGVPFEIVAPMCWGDLARVGDIADLLAQEGKDAAREALSTCIKAAGHG